MLVKVLSLMALSMGLEALSTDQRHVTYQVQQLYQACPPKGEIVVNGSSQPSFDLSTIHTKLSRQTAQIGRLQSALNQLRNRVAALDGGSKDKEDLKVCDVREIRRPDGKLPRDCTEIYALGGRTDGSYTIHPRDSPRPFRVLCELTLDGGWTVIMRRFNGSVDFYRKWTDYKQGFGSLEGEHWLGNDKIHWLTSQKNYKMQVDMRYWANKISYYALYNRFSIDNEAARYKLNIHGYSGNVGHDGMTQHNGRPFSTWDRDYDTWSSHCAQRHHSAFWFIACHHSSIPTGRYMASCPRHDCIMWKTGLSLDKILMKVKYD